MSDRHFERLKRARNRKGAEIRSECPPSTDNTGKNSQSRNTKKKDIGQRRFEISTVKKQKDVPIPQNPNFSGSPKNKNLEQKTNSHGASW